MFKFSPGCYHIKRKPSLSEYNGDLDSTGSTDLWPNKRAQNVSQSSYEAKLDRPRRIYPIRVYRGGKLVAYHSGDIIEGRALAPITEE